MNPQMLIEFLDKKQRELSQLNDDLINKAEEKAKTEGKYRKELRKELLILRKEKIPTTIINDLAKGKNEIALLRYQRDLSESNYYTCISAIENKRLEIEVIRSKLTWLRAEYQSY